MEMTSRIRNLRTSGAVLLCFASYFVSSEAFADAVPDNLTNLSLSPDLLSDIQAALPERTQVNADFLNPSYDPNIRLSESSQVAVTFVDEGAGYRNSLGYFTFNDGAFDSLNFGDIDTSGNGNISISELSSVDGVETGLLFGNFSRLGAGGTLQAGDTTVIGEGTASMIDDVLTMEGGTVFDEGTNLGFVVSANAWAGSYSKGWDNSWSESPNYFSVDFLNPENDATATIDDPDIYGRHIAMGFADDDKSELIIGFEDLRRPRGDNDFNDAVFIVRTDPITAMSETEVTTFSAPAPAIGGLPILLTTGAFVMSRRKRVWK